MGWWVWKVANKGIRIINLLFNEIELKSFTQLQEQHRLLSNDRIDTFK